MARASRWLRTPDYLTTAHLDQCLILQIESRAGLVALDQIAGADGVDAIFIGPADLAADLGHLGMPGHEAVQSAIADAFVRIKAAGKAIGILASDEASARGYVAQGADFVGVGTDVSILQSSDDPRMSMDNMSFEQSFRSDNNESFNVDCSFNIIDAMNDVAGVKS